jgi:PAS domain-containing protein
MQDTAAKSRKEKRAVKKRGWSAHATPPRGKRLEEEEEEEDSGLPSFRKTSVQALNGLFTKAQANVSRQPGGQQREGHLRKLAEDVEEAVFEQYKNAANPHEPTRAYGNQIRTLRYNILQNKDLQSRIIAGNLNATAVARLTPEEMLTTTGREEQREREAKAYDMLRLDRHLAPQVEEELAARTAEGGRSCAVCGSDKVGLMHRYNALEDEQQRRVEMACNACGATMVQEG